MSQGAHDSQGNLAPGDAFPPFGTKQVTQLRLKGPLGAKGAESGVGQQFSKFSKVAGTQDGSVDTREISPCLSTWTFTRSCPKEPQRPTSPRRMRPTSPSRASTA